MIPALLSIVGGLVVLLGVSIGFSIWQAKKTSSARGKIDALYESKLKLEIKKVKLENAIAERDEGLKIVHAEVRRQRNALEAAEEVLNEPIPQNKHDMARAVGRALERLREKVPDVRAENHNG